MEVIITLNCWSFLLTFVPVRMLITPLAFKCIVISFSFLKFFSVLFTCGWTLTHHLLSTKLYTHDGNMYGLDPGIALDSIFLYGEIRDTRVYISPVLLSLCAPVSPTNRYANVRGKVRSIVCSITQSFHFLSYLVFSNQIFQYPLLIST